MRKALPQILFVVVAVTAAAIGFHDRIPEVLAGFERIGWVRAVVAAALAGLGLLATSRMWAAGLTAFGHRLSTVDTCGVFFPAQVGKYLPGLVWPYVAQVRFAARHGVPAAVTLGVGARFLAVHLVSGVLVGAALLPGRTDLSLLIAVPALALLHPGVLTALVKRIPAKLGAPERLPMTWSSAGAALAWMVPAWTAYGLSAFVLVTPLAPADDMLGVAVTCTGAFAIAWVVGLVVVIAPAGLGAREAVLIAALAPLVGGAEAASVALLLRLCHTVADIALAVGFTRGNQGE
ncbi:lysylphosphatidylglycerol synthase domain-containing protein [Allokutzneria multivorans]|uniref:Lysylphosphatidylglycerol synthase domain-containing protein n=1 Tax=Allokutzneria multivorans TaxID=1142134 RepID=A0ABP7RFN6_9PSEU